MAKPKVRVHQIATELGVSSKVFLTWLKDNGIRVKSHSSTMDEEEANRLYTDYRTQKRQPIGTESLSWVRERLAAEQEAARRSEEEARTRTFALEAEERRRAEELAARPPVPEEPPIAPEEPTSEVPAEPAGEPGAPGDAGFEVPPTLAPAECTAEAPLATPETLDVCAVGSSTEPTEAAGPMAATVETPMEALPAIEEAAAGPSGEPSVGSAETPVEGIEAEPILVGVSHAPEPPGVQEGPPPEEASSPEGPPPVTVPPPSPKAGEPRRATGRGARKDRQEPATGARIVGFRDLSRTARPIVASLRSSARGGVGGDSPQAPAAGDPASPLTGKDQPRKRGIERFNFKDRGRERRGVAIMPPVRDRHRKKKKDEGEEQAGFQRPERVVVSLPVSVKDLANQLGVKANELIKRLMIEEKLLVKINDFLPESAVETLGIAYDCEIEIRKKDVEGELEKLVAVEPGGGPRVSRPPVVSILGHVDHGKTTLLDRIRKTNVAAGEAGGITQHTSAYSIELPDGRRITFLDTPGHEAFTAMRARGAHATDLVVLVVAADDGVMPQTIESIHHARAAGVTMVVAITKVDKPNANVLKARQQLASQGLNPRDWGGDTEFFEVSGLTGQGVEDLLLGLTVMAEEMNLAADPERNARGVVIEAHVSEGKGVVATVLIQDGTLRKGDVIIAGGSYGKLRAVHDHTGRAIKEAGPSLACEVSGFGTLPEAGDKFYVLDDMDRARDISEDRGRRQRDEALAARQSHVTLDNLFSQIEAGKVKEIRLIVKADVQGSVEVLQKAFSDLSHEEVKVRILHAAVGGITESDVLLADASDAVIIGFQVIADARARMLAEQKGVEVRTYQVIYKATDELKAAIEGLLEPEEVEEVIGHVEVMKVFRSSKLGNLAGCLVRDGRAERGAPCRLVRDGIVAWTGRIESLRRVKDDVREVREGMECGMKLANYEDIKEADVIEVYTIREVARTL